MVTEVEFKFNVFFVFFQWGGMYSDYSQNMRLGENNIREIIKFWVSEKYFER